MVTMQLDSMDDVIEQYNISLDQERTAWQARAEHDVHLSSSRVERDRALDAQIDLLERRLGPQIDRPVCDELRLLRAHCRALEARLVAQEERINRLVDCAGIIE